MSEQSDSTADGVSVCDGFDFPVGPRGDSVNVWDTFKVDAGLVDPDYKKLFGIWHTGEDWNGRSGGDTDLGSPVYAAAHGRVAGFGYYVPSWGNIVLLEHVMPDGCRVWSQYAHLDQIMVSQVGQLITRGQQIGTIGKGEKSAQYPQGRWVAHLHFEIRRDSLPISAWQPYVNDREQVLTHYYNPTAFINEHRPGTFAATVQLLQRPQVVVDSQRTDRATGLFRRANVDNWYSAPYGYQGSMLWTYVSPDTEANWAEWRPILPAAGQWEVAVYIPSSNATTSNARYQINHADGRTEVAVNQNQYSNQWVSLGTYRFEPGQGYLRLNDVTGERRRGLMIGFDAARWTKVD